MNRPILGRFFCKKTFSTYLFVRKISYLSIMKKENEQNKRPEPTRSELEILQVLWKHGPSTVRQVNDTLNEQKRAVQYTSTLKLMQIMVEKNILKRDESAMKHVYSAVVEEKTFKGFMLERFVDSLYDGSASSLMMQLLGNKKPSKEELSEIRKMLDQLDKEEK